MNLPGTVTFSAEGRIASGKLGDMVCRYGYDGLGRLACKKTPINAGDTELQTKDFYYDGVRRIQEKITRPQAKLLTYDAGTFVTDASGAPAGGAVVANDELALVRADGTTPEQVLIEAQGAGTPGDEVWTDRAYIYGPDYVDEFVAQIDRDGNVMYMLQDANYNVVALVSGGGPGAPGFAPPGTVLEQYTLDTTGGGSRTALLSNAWRSLLCQGTRTARCCSPRTSISTP